MTRTEYLIWRANADLWQQLLKLARNEKKHVAQCPKCKYTIPIKG